VRTRKISLPQLAFTIGQATASDMNDNTKIYIMRILIPIKKPIERTRSREDTDNNQPWPADNHFANLPISPLLNNKIPKK
jgi:hypothetical protein